LLLAATTLNGTRNEGPKDVLEPTPEALVLHAVQLLADGLQVFTVLAEAAAGQIDAKRLTQSVKRIG